MTALHPRFERAARTPSLPRWLARGSLVAAAVWLAACSSNVPLQEPPPATVQRPAGPVTPAPATQSAVASVQAGGAGDAAAVGGSAAALAALKAADALGRVVYFDYDSAVVREDGRPILEAHAKALALNPARKMMVEGHTDERGGREYNLALGQRRAEAVVQAMVLLGATNPQLEPVSYGEERPAQTGEGEAIWAKNRRAELKDRP